MVGFPKSRGQPRAADQATVVATGYVSHTYEDLTCKHFESRGAVGTK